MNKMLRDIYHRLVVKNSALKLVLNAFKFPCYIGFVNLKSVYVPTNYPFVRQRFLLPENENDVIGNPTAKHDSDPERRDPPAPSEGEDEEYHLRHQIKYWDQQWHLKKRTEDLNRYLSLLIFEKMFLRWQCVSKVDTLVCTVVCMFIQTNIHITEDTIS